jgi:small-conductance mechanosensitive channel
MISLYTCIGLLVLDRCYRLCCSSFRYPTEASNRLACTTFQVGYVLACFYGCIMSEPHLMTSHVPYSYMQYISHTIAGYFLYDLIFLYHLPEERSQFVFVIHHMISLTIFVINHVSQTAPDRQCYILMFLLECTSPLLNIWNVIREVYPNWKPMSSLVRIIKWSYAMTRLVGMTGWLYWYISYATWKWNHIINCTSLLLVYTASCYWFSRLIRK